MPTVAGCIDLVVHISAEAGGRRAVREVLAIPGRVEGDVVEAADVFVTRNERFDEAIGFQSPAWLRKVGRCVYRGLRGLPKGSTENATLTTDLLVGLRDRGLDVTKPTLVVLDGSRALRKAVVDVFDHPIIARCQLHKIRNVQDKLPRHLRGPVGKKMRAAYHADSALLAEAQLQALAPRPRPTQPAGDPSCLPGAFGVHRSGDKVERLQRRLLGWEVALGGHCLPGE